MGSGAIESQEASSGSRWRRRWLLAGAVLLVVFAVDLTRPPSAQWSARALVGMIDLYQATASRAMPALGVHCRFEPSCSQYGEASIRRYGTVKGVARTARRLVRCGPWTPPGTVDPP